MRCPKVAHWNLWQSVMEEMVIIIMRLEVHLERAAPGSDAAKLEYYFSPWTGTLSQ